MLAFGFCAIAMGSPARSAAQTPSALPSAQNSKALPSCASIPVELLTRLDSGKAKVGDRFRFKAIDTVVTEDGVPIRAGTIGYGLVEYVSAAGAHAKPGGLVLEARYFLIAKRAQYQVSVDALASSELHSGSNRNAPGIVGAVPVPLVGVAVGAFNYFHAGSNVVIPVGYRFAVTPVGELSKARQCAPEFQISP